MSTEDELRIKKEAEASVKRVYIHKTSAQLGYIKGYLAGATAEHERKRALTKEELTKVFHEQVDSIRTQERNKTIDEIITLIEWHFDNGVVLEPEFIGTNLAELKRAAGVIDNPDFK